MKVKSFRLAGIRAFVDTGMVNLSPQCNVFVGQNNTGKSTLLKALLTLQASPFVNPADVRKGSRCSCVQALLTDVPADMQLRVRPSAHPNFNVVIQIAGDGASDVPEFQRLNTDVNGLFAPQRPHHAIVPFLARRKTQAFEQNITQGIQNQVTGTLSNLYSRVDLLTTFGHPQHEVFKKAVTEIIGLPVTTKASANGKEAGFYFDADTFVTLDRMGDGVAEMLALIVELCLETNKIFVLEEPETNLHPRGLKSLLGLVRASAGSNQFVIATHSNIVVRDLGYEESTKVFRVYRDGQDYRDPSRVEEIERSPAARMALLRELGYEFADLELHDAWLFLEESSSEQIIQEILIPNFAPGLRGRLRTFSAGGASNVEPSVAEFHRLVTFVHLEPVYRDRFWIRTDGDDAGKESIKALREKFKYLSEASCATFAATAFEQYYPAHFAEKVTAALAIASRQAKRAAKAELLREVVQWSQENPEEAKESWAASAKEPITLLQGIAKTLNAG